MNAAAGLLRKCWFEMIPEPLQFIQHADRSYHWATEAPPLKTIIDPACGIFMWIKAEGATITIELDGKTVIYDRRAFGPHGEWICELRRSEQA